MDQDNKKHSFLMERLGVDAISGAVAAFSVAPCKFFPVDVWTLEVAFLAVSQAFCGSD